MTNDKNNGRCAALGTAGLGACISADVEPHCETGSSDSLTGLPHRSLSKVVVLKTQLGNGQLAGVLD